MRSDGGLRRWKRPSQVSKTKAGITAGAVLLSAALAVILFNSWLTTQSFDRAIERAASSQAPTPTASKSDQVWTYNCELPVQRPEEIMLTCADGGWLVTDIRWQTWSSKQALGTGIYSQNMCDPSCAEGTRVDVPITIKLSELFDYKGRNVLKTLDIQAVGGRELPNGGTNMTWDIAEFAVKMNWDVGEKQK